MKVSGIILLLCMAVFGSPAQDPNCSQFCVLNIAINEETSLMEVTIASSESADFINYPVVQVIDMQGDTVGNPAGEFFFFGQGPNSTVVHAVETTLDELPQNFTATVLFMDPTDSTVCIYSYPMECSFTTVSKQVEEFIEVYPNPSSGIVNVVNVTSSSLLSISNASGEIVLEVKMAPGFNPIDLSSLANGIYFLQCVSGNKSFSTQLVRQ